MRHVRLAGIFSIASGLIHGAAVGMHGEHPTAARTFAVLAIAQMTVGLAGLLAPSRAVRNLVALVGVVSVVGWVVAKTVGIGFIDGLDITESIQATDLLCAILATLSVVVTVVPRAVDHLELSPLPATAMAVILTVPALFTATGHTHEHGATASNWPRPYFPGTGLDISGVKGVSKEQESRARRLVADTQRDLMRWSDYRVAEREGWTSIGDQRTGYEHFVNVSTILDGRFLDSKHPESIVYKVYGKTKILVSAMYMAEGMKSLDDPVLTDYAGPLFQWHVHDNLCWSLGEGFRPSITGITDENGKCPSGSRRANVQIPMIHVWVVPHPCGPFAAVEGLAEGQAAVPQNQRVDICGSHSH